MEGQKKGRRGVLISNFNPEHEDRERRGVAVCFGAREDLSSGEMLSFLRRPGRAQPLTAVISCGRKILCSRKQSLWILLALILVCLALQTFVARQNRVEKEMSGPELHFTVTEQDSIPLGLFWGKIKANSAPTESPERPEDVDIVALSSTKKTTTTTVAKLLPVLEECKEKTHIVFLKTHKTASSTLLNILYRFGESRNLTFGLPLYKNNQLFYPAYFKTNFVEGALRHRFKEFHILCNHMRFNKTEVAKLMPPDTYYFSILRNPVQMMESVFSYYKSLPVFRKMKSLDEYLESALSHYNASLHGSGYAHNLLAYDFGLNNNVTADSPDLEKHVSYAISFIEHTFGVVLISEYFDESMILLRHHLCWSLEDVASFKLNTRSNRTRKSLYPETEDKIKKWNALDWRIYLHFNATFWHKLETEIGWQRLEKEVAELRALQAKFANVCLKDGGAVEASQIKDKGLKPFQSGVASIQGYNLNPNMDNRTREMCERLILPELQYTVRLYYKQFPESRIKKSVFVTRRALPRDPVHFVKRTVTDLKKPQVPLVPQNKSAVL